MDFIKTFVRVASVITLIGLFLGDDAAFAQSALNIPEVKVINQRRAFHNGEHNAFTALIRFQNKIYLTFRSCPDGHMVHPTGSIIVLRSDDGEKWEQVHRFSVPKRDTRDPHFLVFQDKLFLYTGTWYSGETTIPQSEYEMNLMLGYAVWTEDGQKWQGPKLLEGTFGHYIWCAASHKDKAYLCGRRKPEFDVGAKGEPANVVSLMLESDDGLTFRRRGTFQETAGDETAFLFETDGDVLAIGRHGRGQAAQLIRLKPPYSEWDRKDLDRPVGGPLLVKWGDHYLVGGRKTVEKIPSTALYWLSNDRLTEFAELPSGGDNSYPGFVELAPGKALISYYSSHERDAVGKPITAIYLAELQLSQ